MDISFAHLWSLDTVKQPGQVDDYAALKREEKEYKNTTQRVFLSCSTPTIIRLVFEHFGSLGESAELFLQELAKQAKAIGDIMAAESLTHWRRRPVLLHTCNSQLIFEK